MTKQKQLKLRGRCPYVRLVGGIGYVCDRNDWAIDGVTLPRYTRRNLVIKCEGCKDVEKFVKH